MIPFHDLKNQYRLIKDEVFTAIKQVCAETAFSGGVFVEKFEKEFAKYCSVKYCVAVNSGTSALQLAMLALGIGKGDEVIVPANTFIATAAAVSHVCATPVFVDCNKNTWEIDGDLIERKISKKTKAIIGVHLYGQPFDVDRIKKICKQHDLFLVEDCAQAQGAEYKRKRVGGFGDIACWSFYPGKNLGAFGEAGAVTTNNKKYAEHIMKLRSHGSEKKYYHDEIGFNMRMDGIQGAVLSVKLKHLDKWNRRRKEIAKMYHAGIINGKIKLQFVLKGTDPVYHLFVVTTKERDKLKTYLSRHGVDSALHYPVPCHLQKAYKFLNNKIGSLPHAEYLAKHCLSLPMFPELTNWEVKTVIKLINKYDD